MRQEFVLLASTVALFQRFVARVVFDDRANVWLNGAPLLTTDASVGETARFYNREVTAPLRAGVNVLAAAVFNGDDAAMLFAMSIFGQPKVGRTCFNPALNHPRNRSSQPLRLLYPHQ